MQYNLLVYILQALWTWHYNIDVLSRKENPNFKHFDTVYLISLAVSWYVDSFIDIKGNTKWGIRRDSKRISDSEHTFQVNQTFICYVIEPQVQYLQSPKAYEKGSHHKFNISTACAWEKVRVRGRILKRTKASNFMRDSCRNLLENLSLPSSVIWHLLRFKYWRAPRADQKGTQKFKYGMKNWI